MAERVKSVIRDRIVFLAKNPGAGHWPKDLTNEAVKFFPVYSYLIIYRPDITPLQGSPGTHVPGFPISPLRGWSGVGPKRYRVTSNFV